MQVMVELKDRCNVELSKGMTVKARFSLGIFVLFCHRSVVLK